MVLRSQYEFEVNSRKQMRRYKYLKTIDIVSHYFPSYNQHFNGTDDKYNRVFRRINIKPTAVQLKYYNSINKINKAEESFDSKVFFADRDKEDSFDAYDKWAFSHESSSNRKDADAPNVANEPEVLDVQEYEKTPEVTATSEVLEVHEAASGTEPPPSFREFVVFAALQQLRCDKERSCLAGIDGHIVLQAVRCNPCMHDFDAVLKVNTSGVVQAVIFPIYFYYSITYFEIFFKFKFSALYHIHVPRYGIHRLQ